MITAMWGQAVEPFEADYMQRLDKGAYERRSPRESTIAIVALLIPISLPWFTGASWLVLWLWRRLNSWEASAVGFDLF